MADIITTLHPENDANINLYPNIKKENVPNGAIDYNKLDGDVKSLLNNIGTLSPSGVDTSTNILAKTSDQGIWIGSDTGYWYYWNGTQYVNGGTYLAANDVTFINNTNVTISALESGKYLISSLCTVSDYPSGVEGQGKDTTFVEISIAPNNIKYIKLFVFNKDIYFNRWFRSDPAVDSGWKIVNNKEIIQNTFNSLDVYFTSNYVNIVGDIIEGYGVSQETDIIVENSEYNITDYIKVDNSLKLGIFGYYSGTSSFKSLLKYDASFSIVRKILYYDKNKNWISTKNLSFNYPYYTEDFIVLDDNVEYIRFTYAVATLSNIQVYQYKYINSNMVKPSAKDVDLIMYMGQSNMAGRGVTSTTWNETIPDVSDIEGMEFKAITDPTKLYAIIGDSFGKTENVSGAIDDGNMKTGSMVNSFIKEYYSITSRTIIAVSASQGGTTISQWQPNGTKLEDALNRLSLAITFLNDNGYTIRNKFVVWCQGESDGDATTSKDTYKTLFNNMANSLLSAGIDKIFIVRIGHRNDTSTITYNDIIEAQTELCQNNKNYIMVSTDFVTMKDRGLMKDQFHYYQAGYNEVGRDSARNVAFYISNHKEPIMYDEYYDNIYITHVID